MKIEVVIYSYVVVCIAMIMFNIASIVVFRISDIKLGRMSSSFDKRIREQVQKDSLDENERSFLFRKLKRVRNLRAFDTTLSDIMENNPELVRKYLENITPVFMALADYYSEKNTLEAAFFPYIIKEYGLFRGMNPQSVINTLLDLVRNQNLYCRENAMEALYSIGDVDAVISGLILIDKNEGFHHAKIITDGLQDFAGNRSALDERIWQRLGSFSEEMQVALLDYFRFNSGNHCEKMLEIMEDEDSPDELRYSCIRYFGRYRYEPAYSCLMSFARMKDKNSWEYAAIAATSLATYPGEKTTAILRELLTSSNWYVRYNASQSLERLGIDYLDMIDIIESDDRYASEMVRYRLDQRSLRERRGGAR